MATRLAVHECGCADCLANRPTLAHSAHKASGIGLMPPRSPESLNKKGSSQRLAGRSLLVLTVC